MNARPALAQTIQLNGQHFWVKTPKCSGSIRARVLTDRTKPGRITVKFTPSRFTRPCEFRVWTAWDYISPGTIRVPIRADRRGGPTVTRTYRVGAGVHALSFGHLATLSAVTYYGLVP